MVSIITMFPSYRIAIPAGEMSMFILVDIVSITKLSVTSSSVSTIPWTKRKFRREYCSCLSISFSRFSTFLIITDTFSSKFLITCSLSFLSFSYSSNFVDIKLTASFKSLSYSSPLIWLSLVIWNKLFETIHSFSLPNFSYSCIKSQHNHLILTLLQTLLHY